MVKLLMVPNFSLSSKLLRPQMTRHIISSLIEVAIIREEFWIDTPISGQLSILTLANLDVDRRWQLKLAKKKYVDNSLKTVQKLKKGN